MPALSRHDACTHFGLLYGQSIHVDDSKLVDISNWGLCQVQSGAAELLCSQFLHFPVMSKLGLVLRRQVHLAAKSGDKSGLITVSRTCLFDCGSRQLYIFSLSYTDSIESYEHKVSEGDVQIYPMHL